MAGMVDLNGTAKYLSDKKKSSRTDECSLIFEVRTKHESFSLSNLKIKEYLSMETLKHSINSTLKFIHLAYFEKFAAKCCHKVGLSLFRCSHESLGSDFPGQSS